MGKLKTVKLAEVKENPVALRSVDQTSEGFQELVGSIRADGILNAPVMRVKQGEDGANYFEIIDGLHRVTAARAANLSEIPAHILEADDAKVLEMQIIGNVQKVETKPSEYTEQLKRILSLSPLMTESELATKLGKSPTWIQQRLSLLKISDPDIQSLINEGKIPLANAYTLAKLPEDEAKDFVEGAMLEPAAEFAARVNQRVKEVNAAKRQGRIAETNVFEPVAHLRKLGEAKAELEAGCPSAGNLTKEAEGFKMGILWMLHNDPESVTEQKTKFDAKEAERKARSDKRLAEIAGRKKERAEIAAKEAANAEAKINGAALPYPELEEPKATPEATA